MNNLENKNDFALMRRLPGAVEKSQPGAKRVLSDMVADALAVAKTNVKAAEPISYPVAILFSAEHIIPNLKANEHFAVIREMVAHLIHIGRIRPQDEDVVMDAITKREKSMSTGWGFGFASPRARVGCVKDILLAVGVSASGVEFDALDNEPVNFIAMFIVPANSQLHEAELQRFGVELVKIHRKNGFKQLFHSNSAEEMWSILKPVCNAWVTSTS